MQHRDPELNEERLLFPRPIRRRTFVLGAVAMLLALVLAPFSDWTYPVVIKVLRLLPQDLMIAGRELPNLYTILAIGAIIWIYVPVKRKYFVWFLVAIAVSSALNEIPKRTVGRARPRYSMEMKHDNRKTLEALKKKYPTGRISTEKKNQWLLFSPRPLYYDGFSSFPSGHTNSAFCLAAFLCVLFPRGRWVFLILATCCGLARVYQYRHYPEDVLFAAGLGWFVANWVFSWAWPARLARWLDEKFPKLELHADGLITNSRGLALNHEAS